MAPRALTVLLVENHEDTRALYGEALTAAGWVVRAVDSLDDAVPLAIATPVDVAVLDIGLDGAGFAVARRLAALPKRPRLIAVTARVATGTPLEALFDAYIVTPCLPEALIEAVQSVTMSPPPRQDLLIISRERAGIYDVMRRFGGVEVRRDLRVEERRRASDAGTPEERRRRDRRARDLTEQLRSDGWAFVAAAERS